MTATEPEAETTAADAALDARRGLADAVARFLAAFFPQCEDVALVLEPAPNMPPLALPVRGVLPACVQVERTFYRFTPVYDGRPFDLDDATDGDE